MFISRTVLARHMIQMTFLKNNMRILKLAVVLAAVLFSSCSGGDVKLYPIMQNGKWGYIDKSGKVVVNAQFEQAMPFSEGLAMVMVSGRKIGFIDNTGQFVVNPQYVNAGRKFSNGLALVGIEKQVDGKNVIKDGFIDRTGKIVVEPQFDSASDFAEGLARIEMKDTNATGDQNIRKVGYIDTAGHLVIPPKFQEFNNDFGDFSEGLAAVISDRKFGFIDRTGNIVISSEFGPAFRGNPELFSEGLVPAGQPDNKQKCGYIDKTGKLQIPFEFDLCWSFSEGLASITIGDNAGFIDKNGKIVINPQFKIARQFKEGLAFVQVGDKFGFIDQTGKIVINPQFDQAEEFSNGLAMVNIDGKGLSGRIGYIDKTGKYIWNPTK